MIRSRLYVPASFIPAICFERIGRKFFVAAESEYKRIGRNGTERILFKNRFLFSQVKQEKLTFQ